MTTELETSHLIQVLGFLNFLLEVAKYFWTMLNAMEMKQDY